MWLIGCGGANFCPECDKSTPLQKINYQPAQSYTSGSAITLLPPNPSGGTPTSYVVTSGALPAGLSLNPSTGAITGTPAAPGVYVITVQASNGANQTVQTFTLIVVPAGSLAVAYATPREFPAGSAIATQTPTLTNATPGMATSYALTEGALPLGLSLGADGAITGTPTTPTAPTTFTVRATNGARMAQTSVTYTVTPAAALTLSYPTVSVPLQVAIATQSPTLTQSTPGVPVTYALFSGALPPGLSLNPLNGEITGIPTSQGVYGFVIQATNGTRSAKASATISVLAPPVAALAATNTQNWPNPATPKYGDPNVTVTPTFAGATQAVLGTSAGASNIGSSLTSGTPVPVQSAGFRVATTYHLRTTNAVGVTTDASVSISPQTVSVGRPTPSGVTRSAGSSTPFSAVVTGGYLGTVTWSVTKGTNANAGTINSATGVWTAPSTMGTVIVTATSVDDPSKSTSTTVTVDSDVSLTAILSAVKHGTAVNSAAPGDTLDYTAVVTNVGGMDSPGVVFALTPGANLSLLPGAGTTTTLGSVTTGAQSGDTSISVAVGTLAPNASATIQFSMLVAATVPAGTASVSAQGRVTSTSGAVLNTDAPNTVTTGDATPTVTPLTGSPLLSVQKTATVDGGGSLAPGGILTYAIAIRNAGAYTVSGAILTDAMPANTTYVASSVTTTSGTPAVANGVLSVTGITIPGNSQVLVTFRVKVADSLPSGVTQISNQGSLAFDPTGGGTNDHTLNTDGDGFGGATLTFVAAGPIFSGLSMGVTLQTDADQDQEYSPGDTVRYTVTIPNTGNQNATGVTFTNTLPTEVAYVSGSATASAGSAPTATGGTLTWTGDVAAGASVTLTYDAVLNLGLTPGLAVDNQGTLAYATRGSGTHDATLLSDGDPGTAGQQVASFTVETAPAPRATMTVVNTDATHNPARPGDILTYTVVLRNVDDDLSLPGVTYTNLIPANTTYVPASLSAVLTGTSTAVGTLSTSGSPLALGWTGTLPISGGVTLTYQVQVDGALATGVTRIVNQGTLTYSPTGTTTSSLLTDGDSTTLGAQTTDLPVAAAPSGSLAAGVSTLSNGCSTTLSWSSLDATSASIDQGVGSLSLASSSGSVTVSPTSTTTYTLTLTGPGGTTTYTATVTVDPAPSITSFSVSPSTLVAGAPLTFSATFMGGTGLITPGNLSITSGGTATLNSGPGSTTAYTLTVTAPCGTSSLATSTVTATVAGYLIVSYSSPQTFVANTAITTQSATVSNEVPGVSTTFALASGSLPAGLSLNTSTGDITGTPTTPGVSTFTITATNGSRTATTGTLTYTVTPSASLTVGYSTPQTFTAGSAISTQSATIGNGTPGVSTTFALASGSLPAGLSLNTSTGDITGTPTTPGVSTFTITATNGSRTATTGTITFTVNAAVSLSLSYATPKYFTRGTAIADQSPTLGNATSGVSTTYAVTTGSLPSGLTLASSTGIISGTPSAMGTSSFVVTATNGSQTATASLTYTIESEATLGVSYVTPKIFTSGTTISTQSATLSNATTGVNTTYALTSGSLPVGLALNTSTGDITGTPSATGVSSFSITATNGTRSAGASVTYTVTAEPLGLSYATPMTFINNGSAISAQNPSATNLTSGITATYALASGSLPTGLALNTSTGAITGTPSANGTYPFSITLTNGTNAAGNTRSSTASVSYTIASATLGYGTPKVYVEQVAITANNPSPLGISPNSYAITVGTLPTGLSLNTSTGAITGTPTAVTAGAVSVTVTGTQTSPSATATQVLSITVGAAAPTALGYTTPVTYTNGTAITANAPHPSGGTPSSYQVTSGVLPAGLSIDPTTGIISGTPTSATSAVSVTITGSNATGTASQTLSITVNGAAPSALNYTTPVTYTNGTPIVPNNPNPSGGTPSSYSVSPALPAGLSLNTTTGVISGTPTANVSSVTYTVTGTNASGSVSKGVVITVNAAAPVALHYSTPVVYAVGETVLNEPNPEGGTPTSYSYTGTLPAGLTFNTSTGVISGSPTAALSGPSYAVTLTITGTNGTSVTQTVTITVPPPVVAHFSANPLSLPVGQSAGLSPVYSGGNGSVNQGIGSVNSGAVVNVTSASAGSITYTLTVTNSYNQAATANVTVTWVNQANQIDLLIPADGGVSSTDVSDSSSPLYGVKVVVPTFPSGDCGSTHLIIYPDANALPSGASLPTGVRACSPTFDFTTTLGYPFRLPITVTLPYTTTLTSPNATISSGDVPVPFYWDPTYAKWVACGIKSIDTVAHKVTFTTLLPGLYTLLVVPGLNASLNASTVSSTGWVATTDGWFQPNQGTFENPGGSSFGMSAFASWYFGQAKYNASTNPSSPYTAGLYSMFRQGALASDDVNARALISRLANGTLESWARVYSQSNYTLTDLQTGLAFITALKVTAQPQLFLMGDARPALSNALATLVTNFTYSSSTVSTFSVMDPNYPGTALTITWNPTTGAFTAYDRAAGYIPAFTKYAFEGHPSVHRLADYERALSGANTGWLNPPFSVINLSQVGDITSVTLDGSTLQVANSSDVTLAGTITNGDSASSAIYWSQNGGTRTAVNLNGGTSFNFSIGALANPYATRVMLETSPNACDSTFGRTGFQEFWVKDRALVDWFINSCFEKGLADTVTPVGWTLQQGANSSIGYPTSPTWSTTGTLNSYTPSTPFAVPSAASNGSAQVTVGNDPSVTSIKRVLDGASAFRLNHIGSGSQISRVFQTVTVPTTVADPSLSFYWAAAMQNAGHGAADQPYVDIWIQDVTDAANVTMVYYKHFYAGDPTYPGWIYGTGTGASQWMGIAWQKVSLTDLSALKGHKLKITIIAADCTQGGHGGYAYIDNVACN